MRESLIRLGGWRRGTATVVAVTVVCTVFLAGSAFGQPSGDSQEKKPPAGEQPKAAKTDTPPTCPAQPADDVPAPRQPACGEGEPVSGWAEQLEAREKTGQAEKPATAPESSSPGGKPKWVCDKETIVVPTVWVADPLVCQFAVRNEGDADLTIKLRGS